MKFRFSFPVLTLPLIFVAASCTQGAPVAPLPNTPTSPVPKAGSTGGSAANGSQAADSNEGNLLLGNPTDAAKDPDNYLVERPQYTLSYNRSKGEANWVAWHIDAQDLGETDRSNKFRPDPALPKEWQIGPNDYRNSGYDRGHVCPSGDRTASPEDNQVTFYMSNMLPQTAELNRAVWADSENAIRDIVRAGNEVYVVAGGAGKAATIDNGKVNVPKICWKIILILPAGENDLQRINAQTRVLTLAMPNVAQNALKDSDWRQYIVTTKKLEEAVNQSEPLKFDFFAALPKAAQSALEAKKDDGV